MHIQPTHLAPCLEPSILSLSPLSHPPFFSPYFPLPQSFIFALRSSNPHTAQPQPYLDSTTTSTTPSTLSTKTHSPPNHPSLATLLQNLPCLLPLAPYFLEPHPSFVQPYCKPIGMGNRTKNQFQFRPTQTAISTATTTPSTSPPLYRGIANISHFTISTATPISSRSPNTLTILLILPHIRGCRES